MKTPTITPLPVSFNTIKIQRVEVSQHLELYQKFIFGICHACQNSNYRIKLRAILRHIIAAVVNAVYLSSPPRNVQSHPSILLNKLRVLYERKPGFTFAKVISVK